MPVEGGTSGGKAAAAVEKFARNPPESALVIFTDGSALDINNPGPWGGGLVARLPKLKETEYVETVIPLGQGDNKKGEMGGLNGAACVVEDALTQGKIKESSEVFVFSDSTLCIGHVDRGWYFSRWEKLAHATTRKLRKLRKKVRLALHWVRGHAGIPGDEMADKAAGTASRIARDEGEGGAAGSDGKQPGHGSKKTQGNRRPRRYSG